MKGGKVNRFVMTLCSNEFSSQLNETVMELLFQFVSAHMHASVCLYVP